MTPNGIPEEEWKACREAVHKEVIELRTDYAPKRTLNITELTTAAEVAVPAARLLRFSDDVVTGGFPLRSGNIDRKRRADTHTFR